jgi:cytochrome P450
MRRTATLPPGPTLPAVGQTLLSVTRPLSFPSACQRRYGDLYTLRIFPVGDIVCVTDATTVKKIITSDPEVFRTGDAYSVMDFIFGRRSLLLLDGPEHIQRRQILMPSFRGESVRRYRDSIGDIVAAAMERWPVGTGFRLMPRFQATGLEIIMRTVFGMTDVDRLAAFRRLVPRVLHVNPALMLFPALRRDFGPRSPGAKLARVLREIDDILYGEIARRRTDPAQADRDDILSLLVRARGQDGQELSDRELRDHLVTLLVVGHETTATSLAWLFERLLRHPADLAKVRAEAGSGETTYVDAVIDETLRVRPVITDIARTLSEPTLIGRYAVPAGTMVALSLFLIHNNPADYPDPQRFRPARFLGHQQARPVFLPFGGGPHRCLGAQFARTVMRATVHGVLSRADLRPVRTTSERARLVGPILVPSRGAEAAIAGPRVIS